MLRTTCPNVSVITNFGCRATCWYCIWKGHELEHVNEQTNWNKLEGFLTDHKDKGKVSVSGGGDCLYHFDMHIAWWLILFMLTEKLNMKVDVHTREKFTNQAFWRKINKCVFSSDRLKDDLKYLEQLSCVTQLRITHLVTAKTTDALIEEYLSFQKRIGCQFTIKELIKFDDNNRYKEIRKKYPNIYYLDAGDYNIYYMPDNSIRGTFL